MNISAINDIVSRPLLTVGEEIEDSMEYTKPITIHLQAMQTDRCRHHMLRHMREIDACVRYILESMQAVEDVLNDKGVMNGMKYPVDLPEVLRNAEKEHPARVCWALIDWTRAQRNRAWETLLDWREQGE